MRREDEKKTRLEVPMNLKHKPIMACEYAEVTGEQDSDAKFISVGRSQYGNGNDVSIKMFRYGKRWSPQSEEVPASRLPFMMGMLLEALYRLQKPTDDGCAFEVLQRATEVVDPDGVGFIRQCFEDEVVARMLKSGLSGVKELINKIDIDAIGK